MNTAWVNCIKSDNTTWEVVEYFCTFFFSQYRDENKYFWILSNSDDMFFFYLFCPDLRPVHTSLGTAGLFQDGTTWAVKRFLIPPGSPMWMTVNSNADFLWGCFIRHQPGLPGGGWAGQASLSPTSSDFCLQLSLQALVSLLLTVPALLAPVLIWALLSSSMLSKEPWKHMEIHCCWTRLTHEKTHVWIQAHFFLHNCQGCDLVSVTNTLYWEALHPQFTPAVNAASWN